MGLRQHLIVKAGALALLRYECHQELPVSVPDFCNVST
jgi:hypothetical protein